MKAFSILLALALFASLSFAVCNDSDYGVNLYTKGTTTGTFLGGTIIYTNTDACLGLDPNNGQQKISEWYCKNGNMQGTSYWCNPGNSCIDGACVLGNSLPDYYAQLSAPSSVQYGGQIHVNVTTRNAISWPSASSSTTRVVWKGPAGSPATVYYNVPALASGGASYSFLDVACSSPGTYTFNATADVYGNVNESNEGNNFASITVACLAPPPVSVCNDSDGGANPWVQGITTGALSLNNSTIVSRTDSCTQTGLLTEYYCNDVYLVAGSTQPCPTGQVCSAGKCQQPIVPPPQNAPAAVQYISSCQILNQSNTVYTLTQDINSSWYMCFNVSANNVTLDCQGHSVTGISGAYYGVYSKRNQTTVRNCAISNYTYGMMFASNAYYGLIENNNITDGTVEIYSGSMSSQGYYAIHGNRLTNCELSFDYSGHHTVYNNVFQPASGSAIRSHALSPSYTTIFNNTFLSGYIDILDGTANTIYWNNFSHNNSPYVKVYENGNFLNTSVNGRGEGNIYANVMSGAVPVSGAYYSTGVPSLLIGTSGAGVPYNSTTSQGKIVGNITDYAPLTYMPLVPNNNVSCNNSSIVGDANGDGAINSIDALIISKVFTGQLPMPANKCCLDVNNDTIVNSVDSLMVMKYFAGMNGTGFAGQTCAQVNPFPAPAPSPSAPAQPEGTIPIQSRGSTPGGSALPDLIISSLTTQTGIVGTAVTGTIATGNQGTATAGASVTTYYINGNIAGTINVPALPPGSTSTAQVSITCQSQGTMVVSASANSNRAVTEANPGNGDKATTMTCTKQVNLAGISASDLHSASMADANLAAKVMNALGVYVK